MKKIVCFFCDIMGTIEGSGTNTPEKFQEFGELLLKLRERSDAEELVFSLISTASCTDVVSESENLKHYFDSSIVFGRQFFEQGYIEGPYTITQGGVGKVSQIVDYVQRLEQEYQVEEVYYADDSKMLHDILLVYTQDLQWKNRIHSIIPRENRGLFELNELLQRHFEDFKPYEKKKSDK